MHSQESSDYLIIITMKLAVSSASFAAALSAVAKHSNAAMAAAVDAAYENKVVEAADVKTRSLGEECSFASSGLHRNDADTGILSCGADSICVEDGRSSLGGVCVSADPHMPRNLLVNTTCATKCTGTNACATLSQVFKDDFIGEGSCCGVNACNGITGK